MNERIKELAEQAGAHESGFAYYRGEKKPENAVTFHSVDLEMFAELIVQECIELNRQELAFNAFERLLTKYKEHFGVE